MCFFEEQNIHTISADGEVMLTLLASFAQAESLSVSENCKWRIRKGFEEGKSTSVRLLGYQMIDGEFTIVPEEAETVRRIFNLYAEQREVGMGQHLSRQKALRGCYSAA